MILRSDVPSSVSRGTVKPWASFRDGRLGYMVDDLVDLGSRSVAYLMLLLVPVILLLR